MSDLVIFAYRGVNVAFDPTAQRWNLNEMHRAAGGVSHKAPHKWLAQVQARELLAALAEEEQKLGEISPSFVETREGRNGGTWAHWQIAAAYAHYLNPRFYLQWNRWAMERVQQLAGAAPTPASLAALEARLAAVEAQLAGRPVEMDRDPPRLPDGRRPRRRDAQGRLVIRRVTERVTEEITLTDVPTRPISDAIREALRQAGRPLRPIELTALLQAAGVAVTHPVQVSSALWHLWRAGEIARTDDGRYTAR